MKHKPAKRQPTPQERYEEFMKRPEWPGQIDQKFYDQAIKMLDEVWQAYNRKSEEHYKAFCDSRALLDRIKNDSPVDVTGSEDWERHDASALDAISDHSKAIRKSLLAMELRDILKAYRGGAPKIDISYREN